MANDSGGFVGSERIIAVGLLTKNDVRLLGPTFDRLWPVEEARDFSALLQLIDDADRELSLMNGEDDPPCR